MIGTDQKSQLATLAERDSFDEVIDVRTPAEFTEDHLPGAINAPVLSDAERVLVGTRYKHDPFGATRMGAALVARNIAQQLETRFADRKPQWRPLVYCWRGGKRSGAMTAWFNLIGWRARQLDGGYKAYRHWVLAELAARPAALRYVVVAGHTGSGKTRLLQALVTAGGQVLDLEGLARHRGSLLGALPGQPQPSQKAFDSALVAALAGFDAGRPVFIEAESKRIGQIALPETLMQAMRSATRLTVDAPRAARIAFLAEDYAHLFADPADFKALLARLTMLHGKQTIARWHALIDAHDLPTLFAELIDQHYDPAYRRSSPDHLLAGEDTLAISLNPQESLAELAAQLVRQYGG